jgi:hypothetical protein
VDSNSVCCFTETGCWLMPSLIDQGERSSRSFSPAEGYRTSPQWRWWMGYIDVDTPMGQHTLRKGLSYGMLHRSHRSNILRALARLSIKRSNSLHISLSSESVKANRCEAVIINGNPEMLLARVEK